MRQMGQVCTAARTKSRLHDSAEIFFAPQQCAIAGMLVQFRAIGRGTGFAMKRQECPAGL
jgi:hypothetical protein